MGNRGLQSHNIVFKNSNLNTQSLTPDLYFICDIRNRIDMRWIKVIGKMGGGGEQQLGNALETQSGVSVKEAGVPLVKAGFRWFRIKSREISGLCLSRA